MAELQWIVEVRCTNALLAEIKIGERGEHVIVGVPDRNLDPAEFDKLIEGLEAANLILEANQKKHSTYPTSEKPAPIKPELGTIVEIEKRENLYQAQLLKSGELVYLSTGAFFAPSEFNRFIAELKAIRQELRARLGSAS